MSAGLSHRPVISFKTSMSVPLGQSGPTSPHTPLRATHVPSNFGSPSSIRAEEDVIVIEFGARRLRLGFGGDVVPRGSVWFGHDQERRTGDFRQWQPGYVDDWRRRGTGPEWGRDRELYRFQFNMRNMDLGLVGDKIERGIRDAFTRYLMIDSRPRRIVMILSTAMPMDLISTTLTTIFKCFQPPTISLLSNPVCAAFAAGLRSALVVDLGWHETVVTAVSEYREIKSSRSIRAGRMLVEQTHALLGRLLAQAKGESWDSSPEREFKALLSFEECEDITMRMVWCKPGRKSAARAADEGLPILHERDESEPTPAEEFQDQSHMARIPLQSSKPPTVLQVLYEELTEPCENTYFDSQQSASCFDTHETPIVLLVYQTLLRLPPDVRGLCMSRIIFTGGGASVLGLRGRIFDDLFHLIQKRDWEPMQDKALEKVNDNKPRLQNRGTRTATDGPTSVTSPPNSAGGSATSPTNSSEQDGVWHDAANASPEPDPFAEHLNRAVDQRPHVQGRLRAVESLGAWSGASLLTQLKVPAVATIDRELWLAQGPTGASRPSEVNQRLTQRQSLGTGGLMRGGMPGATSWTLGVWGNG